MRDFYESDVMLIRTACEVLHDLGGEKFPEEFFELPAEIIQTRLSSAYQGESLCDVMQCRRIVDRAMVRVS